jgi:hypothetical protein
MSNSASQPEPWERQASEPNRWFARFESYRLAGPGRSLLAVYKRERQTAGRNTPASRVPGAWDRAATRWHWRERAESWDEQQRQQARAIQAQVLAEMNERHIHEAQALQSKALQRLKALDLDALSAADVLRYLVEATRLERTARGEPEAIEERRLTGKGGGPVGFSLEDAVNADKELEDWHHAREQQTGGGTLPQGNPEVP